MPGFLTAGFAAAKAALDTWNSERGKAAAKEQVQLGMQIARAKDDRAAAAAALNAARVMAEQASDEELDNTARQLARLSKLRKSKPAGS